MEVKFGNGSTEFGPGVLVSLSGDELAIAIDTYLAAHGFHVTGPRTTYVNGKLCQKAEIYVDPSGSVMVNGTRYNGRGTIDK